MILYRADDDADEVRRRGLGADQRFIPGGFFFGWLLENALITDEVAETRAPFVARELTGPEAFARIGGELSSRTIAPAAFEFARDYVHAKPDGLFADVAEQFPVPSVFDVRDTWHNYEWMRIALVDRYSRWRSRPASD